MNSWSSWRSGHDYGAAYAPNANDDPNRIEPIYRNSFPSQATADASRSSRDSWQIPEERVLSRPSSFTGFPDHHRRAHTPVHIVWLESVPARAVNPRFSGPLPRFTAHQQQAQFPAGPSPPPTHHQEQDNEQNIVLSKLKREIYNPVPKQMTRRLNSYYRDQQNRSSSSSNDHHKEIKDKDDGGKSCAICLEDFEPREQVMLTPCDHMFHEECILPWMKSNGQCPVCRYVLSERIRQTATNVSNNNASNVAATELIFGGELMSMIRAMEAAFLWGNSR